jgi:hypothetical protein
VTCTACQAAIDTEYYDVNGHVLCARCRAAAESAAEVPKGIGPFLTATAFGLVAAVAGTAIYYAVIAIAKLEIGYVAVLIGYMVGYAVRKAAGGRGGLRFQILAITLTYFAVGLAYTPIVIGQVVAKNREAARSAPVAAGRPANAASAAASPGLGSALLSVLLLFAFAMMLPVLFVVGSFPSGLISAFIIFIGLRQSWKMTGAAWIQVLGPYRVGARAAVSP